MQGTSETVDEGWSQALTGAYLIFACMPLIHIERNRPYGHHSLAIGAVYLAQKGVPFGEASHLGRLLDLLRFRRDLSLAASICITCQHRGQSENGLESCL